MSDDRIDRSVNRLEDRADELEAREFNTLSGLHDTSMIVSNATIAVNATSTTTDLRGTHEIPSYARGVWGFLYAQSTLTDVHLLIDSADDTPDVYSSRLTITVPLVQHSGMVMVRLGAPGGGNPGAITLKAIGAGFSSIYFYVVGWWA